MHFFSPSSGEQAIADALAEHLNRAAFTTHCCSTDYARRNAHPIVHARRWWASQCVIHTSDVCVRVYLACYSVCDFQCVCARACVFGVCVAICVIGCVFPSFVFLVFSEIIKAIKECGTQCPTPLSHGLLKKLLKILKSGVTASIQYLNLDVLRITQTGTRENSTVHTPSVTLSIGVELVHGDSSDSDVLLATKNLEDRIPAGAISFNQSHSRATPQHHIRE